MMGACGCRGPQPTIFIGSSLNEPLLYQAVAARSTRFPERNELRPRGFLVCRSISPAQIDALQDFSLVPLVGEAKEFFDLVADITKPFPDRKAVLLSTNPDLEGMFTLIREGVSRPQLVDLEMAPRTGNDNQIWDFTGTVYVNGINYFYIGFRSPPPAPVAPSANRFHRSASSRNEPRW
jgi:hypothetical protein